MKILYLDCPTGAAGDMLLGALLAAGASEAAIRAGLAKVPFGHEYELNIRQVKKNGLVGTKVDVLISGEKAEDLPAPQSAQHHHGHAHRRLTDILNLLEAAALSPWVREKCRSVFCRLADAEAHCHGIKPTQVHFHEVGAVDSIVDIIGTILALEQLGAEQVYCSPLPLGSGFVRCAHGLIPVPAPATLELLKGIPVRQSDLAGELVTPTAAALLADLVTKWTAFPSLCVDSVGCGAGTRDLPVPNLLRAVLGTAANEASPVTSGPYGELFAALETEQMLLLETNLDDQNPEHYPYILERLLAQGALDAFIQPIIMKKGRPGCILSVLTTEDKLASLTAIVLIEATTLGVRVHKLDRYKLSRTTCTVQTPFGPIGVKLGCNPATGECLNLAPEFEECRQAALAHQVSLKSVYQEALRAAEHLKAIARQRQG